MAHIDDPIAPSVEEKANAEGTLGAGELAAAESAEGQEVEGESAEPQEGEVEGATAGGPGRLPEIPIADVAEVHCQDDLNRVLENHRQWVAAVLDPKVAVAAGRANLKGADLRPYNLSGVNLSGANLSGANLAGVDLSSANLSAADLSGAVLACAVLIRTRMRGAKIDGTDFRGADLTQANVTGLDFSKSILKSVDEPVRAVAVEAPSAAAEVTAAPEVEVSVESLD